MAHVFLKPGHCGTPAIVCKSQILWSEKKTNPSILPQLQQAGDHSNSKVKTSARAHPVAHSKITTLVTGQLKNPREPRMREKLRPGRRHPKIRLMRMMLRNQRASLQELSNQELFLARLSEQLVCTILDTGDSVAEQVRTMMQQRDIVAHFLDILEWSDSSGLQQLKSEFQEWRDEEEGENRRLEQQAEQLKAKLARTHEEVNFLSTYMDHRYPIRLVHIINLRRQLQQVKDSQQEELDNLNEIRGKVLRSVADQEQEKKRQIWRSLIAEIQHPHEVALLQKTWDSQARKGCLVRCMELVEQLKEKMPKLRAQVGELQAHVLDSREVIFKDVLLRKPKCPPDMDIILDIPVEGLSFL